MTTIALNTLAKRKSREKLRNRNYDNNYNLMKRHGLTREEYNKKREQQNGVCAICKNPCKTGMSLSVDHNHTTGQIRDLLCKGCNRWVGILESTRSTELLKKCQEYINKHNQVLS